MNLPPQGAFCVPLALLLGLWSGAASAAAPVAFDQTVDIDEGASFTLCATDADGDLLEYVVIDNPTSGDVLGAPPDLNYIPGFGFAGSDSLTFRASDGVSDSNIATVTINQGGGSIPSAECSGGGGGNSAPVADAQAVSGDEDMPLAISLTGSDADSDPLTFSVASNPTNGSLSVSGANIIYTPNAGFSGSDSFTFTVNDGTEDSAAATVSITINAVNDAPVANDQAVGGDENTPLAITLTASDADNDSLTFSVVSDPANGSLSGTAPNLTYTPGAAFSSSGSDSFTFIVNDGTVDSAPATVRISKLARLNDTGSTRCGSVGTGAVNSLDCAAVGATADTAGADGASPVPAGQDAHFGRDVTANDDSDGHAGFSFTKLDSNGEPLADQSVPYGAGPGETTWDCVRDNVTGLTWEVKTTDAGLHDADHTYTWFDSGVGASDGGICSGGTGCDTDKFVADVNAAGWCGANDWRLPFREELLSIVAWDRTNPAVDSRYFPNTGAGDYWSVSTSIRNDRAWVVLFASGQSLTRTTTQPSRLRLVRGSRP